MTDRSDEAKIAVIIGAGPAGLTAAYELLRRTDIKPVVLEMSELVGGLSRTVNYKGNRIDIGGHRFFSKSDRVMDWWLDVLPLESSSDSEQQVTYQRRSRSVAASSAGPDPEHVDRVMLIRQRKSRIYFLRRFFDYPISLSLDTLRKLGAYRSMAIVLSYLRSALTPFKRETNLEEFFVNRFGRVLYSTFFKSYTEKVWGVPCRAIGAEWGAQRIKGLSIAKAVLHVLRRVTRRKRSGDIRQKSAETSLIEQFLYPKLGPGQMWEEVARRVEALGGEILMQRRVDQLTVQGNRVVEVATTGSESGSRATLRCDYVFSTMPVKDLVAAIDGEVPQDVREISEGLVYRDFITVGLLLRGLRLSEETKSGAGLIQDNWIYVQEPDVKVGRIQIFNNWSPYMVRDPDTAWIGLEYFCYTTDALWSLPDDEMAALAARELESLGFIESSDVIDSTVIRMEKTYPCYFGSYDRFPRLRRHLDGIENLFLLGRNGMHRYNNQDHSMLTAMTAVDNLVAGITSKENLWAVNAEEEYHEERAESRKPPECSREPLPERVESG